MSNFFKELYELMGTDDCMIDLTVVRKSGKITIGIAPKADLDDDIGKNIPIMNMTGPPEELDKEFFDKLKAPMEKVVTVITSQAEFEKELEEKSKKAAYKKKEDEEVEKIIKKLGEIEKAEPKNYTKQKDLVKKSLKKYPDNKRLLGQKEILDSVSPEMEFPEEDEVEVKVEPVTDETAKSEEPVEDAEVVEDEKKEQKANQEGQTIIDI